MEYMNINRKVMEILWAYSGESIGDKQKLSLYVVGKYNPIRQRSLYTLV